VRRRDTKPANVEPVVYHGVRDPRPGATALVTRNGVSLRNARPGEIEWGFAGQDPLTLARALVRDACGRDAVALSHAFMLGVVAKLPAEGWTMTAADVEAWVATARASSAAKATA
jgi:hypothetical protein